MSHPAALLRQLEQRAKRRFGQNFLAQLEVARSIVATAGVGEGDRVIEVGPGLGVLTEQLLAAGADVTAIELDRDMAAFVRERHPQVHLLEGDARKAPLPEAPYKVVANLPYNVGTAILLRFVTLPEQPRSITVMLQKEVAERICAAPGDRKRGSLSVAVQARATPRIAFQVAPGSFHPPPKVWSAVVHLVPNGQGDRVGDLEGITFDEVCRAAFSQPRKTLRNCLKGALGPEAAQVMLATGVDGGLRPAVLQPEDFERMARALVEWRGR